MTVTFSPAQKRLWRDFLRTATTIGLAVFLLFGDVGVPVILAGVGIMVGTVGLCHLLRRIMFPYVDPKALVKSAVDEQNMPAAVIFFSICLVLVSWSFMLITLLK